MTKKEKIAALAAAMARGEREGGETFYSFAAGAPEELEDLYLGQYEVRDVDYEAFSDACDLVAETYDATPDADREAAVEAVDEASDDRASCYNGARLAYLNVWNQDEVAEIVREYGEDIAAACAVWYDRRVREAALIIVEWVEKED